MSDKIETVVELLFSGFLRKNKIAIKPTEEELILKFIKDIAVDFDTLVVLNRSKQRLNRCLERIDRNKNREIYDIIKSVIDDITMKRVKYE